MQRGFKDPLQSKIFWVLKDWDKPRHLFKVAQSLILELCSTKKEPKCLVSSRHSDRSTHHIVEGFSSPYAECHMALHIGIFVVGKDSLWQERHRLPRVLEQDHAFHRRGWYAIQKPAPKMLSDLGRGEVLPYYMVSTVHHVLGSVQLTTSVVGWAKQHSTMTWMWCF